MNSASTILDKENANSKCFYHPTTESAVASCFRCRRPICENDSQLYDVNLYDYDVSSDICIPCYAIVTQKDAESNFSTVSAYVFLLVWSIFVLIIFFPLVVFSYFIFRNIRNKRKKLIQRSIESKTLFNDFLKSIDPDNTELINKITNLTCYTCGMHLDLSDLYCQKCGDSIDIY